MVTKDISFLLLDLTYDNLYCLHMHKTYNNSKLNSELYPLYDAFAESLRACTGAAPPHLPALPTRLTDYARHRTR